MNTRPTVDQVAVAAAQYASSQFTALQSWLSYERELANEWLKDHAFRCACEYTIEQVMQRISYNTQMRGMAAQHGGGARGVAYVCGHVVGEWTAGHTTIDRELDSW